MKYLISFADKKYAKSQKNLEKTALAFGAEKCILYSDDFYKNTSFYTENSEILRQERGAGYWLWKPYIILETLKMLGDNDVLMYLDSGMEVIHDMSPLYSLCEENDVVVFEHSGNMSNENYTQNETFERIGIRDEGLLQAKQLWAGAIVCKKTLFSLRFMEEWLGYCKVPQNLIDMHTPHLESNIFITHRHDQSILSIVAYKYNVEAFRDPSQYGNSDIGVKENSPYGQIFDLHRNGKMRHKSTAWKCFYRLKQSSVLAPIRTIWRYYKKNRHRDSMLETQ